jgi:hypothetical protein
MKAKLKKFGLFIIIFSSFIVTAQNEAIQIKDLEMPNAPALTLLDQTNTNIDTPKNLQALTTTLMNSINNNIGFEINPYMIFTKNKNFYDFYNVKWNGNAFEYKGWFSSLKKDLTISFAKVKKEEANYFSIGARTNLIRIVGNEKKYLEKLNLMESKFILLTKDVNEINAFRSLKNIHGLSDSTISKLMSTITAIEVSLIDNEFVKTDLNDANIKSFIDNNKIPYSEYDSFRKQRNVGETLWGTILRFRGYKVKSDLNSDDTSKFAENEDAFRKEFATNLKLEDAIDKPVFALDIATAYSHFYAGNNFSDGQTGKFGAWSTFALNVKLLTDSNKEYLSLYGYARYIRDNAFLDVDTNLYTDTENFDLGAKLEFQYDKLTFAYEYINRIKEKDNYRSVGSIKYKFSDKIVLNGGFGKNFEQTDNLVSFLGISWGIESDNNFTTK